MTQSTPQYAVHVSMKSGNSKTGAIPVTTTPRAVCPIGCVHRGTSCYFENGGSAIFWTHVDRASESPELQHVHSNKRGTQFSTKVQSWEAFCTSIAAGAFPRGLARFAQGGDLPGDGVRIDRAAVLEFARVSVAAGVRWIIYTHYLWASPNGQALMDNLATIRALMAAGLTINVSCDTLEQVDRTRDLGLLAAVTAPSEWDERTARTAGGNRLVQCPATYRETGPGSSCASCGGCAVGSPDRATWVFPAHGAGKKTIDKRLALFAAQGVDVK